MQSHLSLSVRTVYSVACNAIFDVSFLVGNDGTKIHHLPVLCPRNCPRHDIGADAASHLSLSVPLCTQFLVMQFLCNDGTNRNKLTPISLLMSFIVRRLFGRMIWSTSFTKAYLMTR
ncbi:hypothetical protein CEXT_232181 [Caerostris extrusa]|uniref:Uncharacterized protein n=1 Tax=Caerostris extrusa TaxID=172846 RepID=A0AAV4P0R9_CAEEX|nr:hypothetical protein CEXT_232181 [Caerostris extrusa]